MDRVNSEIEYNIKTRSKNFRHEPYRVITKNKDIIWVLDSTVVQEDENGNITHFHGIVKDITTQYLTELELKKSEQRFSYSLEAANIASWELNLDNNEFNYSNKLNELFGFNNGETIKTYDDLLKFIQQDDRPNVKLLTQNAIDSSSSFEVEYRVNWSDGNVKWISQQGKISPNVDGTTFKMYGIIRDVSARVSSNAFLLESERRFKSFVENSPNGIAIHLDSKILYANEMAKTLLKVKPNEKYIGEDIRKYIHPDFRVEVFERLKTIKEGIRRKPYFESQFVCSDNTSIDVALASSVVEYKDTKAIQTVFYDITSVKKTQDELRKSEERYRSVFIQSPLGILHFDKDGVITDCNDEFAAIIGTTRNNLIGFNMPLRLEDTEVKNVISECLTKGGAYYQDTYTSVLTGKATLMIGRFNAIYSSDNEIVGGVGLIEDISKRAKNEKLQKALFKISETASKNITMKELYVELHHVIKELMPAENFYVAMHQKETNIISFPFHVDEYDEHPEPQIFGNGLTEYILRTKKSMIINAEMDKELQAKGEVELSGEFSQVWVGVFLEFEGMYNGVLVVQDYENANAYTEEDLRILQFVSEQIVKVLDKKYADRRLRESIEALSKAKKELEIINQNKDRFFSIIAHDLRAPFNTLLGVSELISGDINDMTMKEVREISSVIHSSTENLFKLIENLLNWSRIQMGSFKIDPEILNIEDLLFDTLEIVKYSAKAKSITIENKVSKQSIYADEECVKTVIRNLLNNSIKFTHRGGRIVIKSRELRDKIEISVQDNGVGMDKDVASKLFDITSKTSTAGTENEKGTGLGLILCKD
jgi:PAS domain S-box-containing protein